MLKKFIGGAISVLFAVLYGANLAANWIGKSTVAEDAAHAMSLADKAADWFFALPNWAVGLFGLAVVISYWCWLFEPWRNRGSDAPQGKTKSKPPEIKLGFQKTALQSVEIEFQRHDAPNQDGVARNWKRVCAGIVLRNVNPNYPASLKMRIYALDPNGWRFADETPFDGELAVGEWVDHYPVELHMRMNNTPRLKYERKNDQMTDLNDDEELQIVVELHSKDAEHEVHTFAVRTPRNGCERFVAELVED